MRIEKYRNKRCKLGEIKFQSILERTLYLHIVAFLKGHTGFNIHLQYKIQITPKNSVSRAINYIADYLICRSIDEENIGKEELIKKALLIDAKGIITSVFTNKRAMLYHMHGVIVHMAKEPHEVIALLKKYVGKYEN
ncbi:MAG: DUF1064 domain-containing protein [Paraclostridium sp.]